MTKKLFLTIFRSNLLINLGCIKIYAQQNKKAHAIFDCCHHVRAYQEIQPQDENTHKYECAQNTHTALHTAVTTLK